MTAKILIADDDPHIHDVIRIAATGNGFATIEAANGQIALTHLQREEVDLVILDIGMPYMDGFECCKAIRAQSDVPVLFLPRKTKRSIACWDSNWERMISYPNLSAPENWYCGSKQSWGGGAANRKHHRMGR